MHEVLEDGEEGGVAAAGVEEFGVELDAEDAVVFPGFDHSVGRAGDYMHSGPGVFDRLVMEGVDHQRVGAQDFMEPRAGFNVDHMCSHSVRLALPVGDGGSGAVHSATATHGLTQKTSVNGPDDQAAASGSERPGRILISVPKRFFKRAVKRNLLKRRIREAYRVRKLAGVDILFQYNSAEIADFAVISAEVAAILERVQS